MPALARCTTVHQHLRSSVSVPHRPATCQPCARQCSSATARTCIVRAGDKIYKGDNPSGADDARYLSMRAEVEAPFRTARIFLVGFSIISASVATLVATSQLIGALAHGPNAFPLEDALQTWGIDIGCVFVLALIFRNDWQERNKQLLRMGREERLASCKLELANGKSLQLGRLRSFARPVVFCGTPEQVAAARDAAEPFKELLLERGVFLVAIPVTGTTIEPPAVDKGDAEALAEALKWEGRAIRIEDWQQWFNEQAGAANATLDKGLYLSLRLDGRVRASGTGIPPWNIFSAQLAPMEGMWKGVMDGMDGRVGG